MEIQQGGTGSGSGGISTVTDGITTVTSATQLTFTGAVVANLGGGNAGVTVSTGGTPGGLNLQVQYNNAGVFGGISGAVTNGTILNLTNPLLGGATLTTSSVNGVTLTTGGSTTTFLNANGAYSTPAGGMAIGGSITSATAGSVLYAGAAGVLAQDNSNFFYDETNHRLGLGTTTPRTKLELLGDGAILAIGTFGSGFTEPAIGAGTRMLWYPRKAAFRAGNVSGGQWNNINIGTYSAAFGSSTLASGSGSFAVGIGSVATGNYSAALGNGASANGESSFSIGNSTEADGLNAISIGTQSFVDVSADSGVAIGYQVYVAGIQATGIGTTSQAIGANSVAIGGGASNADYSVAIGGSQANGMYSLAGGTGISDGDYSVAIGNNVDAYSFSETVFGANNTSYTPASTTAWNTADRLFVIGNGASSGAPSDALIVYKSGIFVIPNLAGTGTRIVTASSTGQLGTALAPLIAATNDLLAQTATVSSVVTATSPNDGASHQYQVGAYVDVTAISAGTVTVTYTYTDENSTSRTLTLFGMGLTTAAVSATGFTAFPVATIRVKANTAITLVATFAGVSITYDVGGNIIKIN